MNSRIILVTLAALLLVGAAGAVILSTLITTAPLEGFRQSDDGRQLTVLAAMRPGDSVIAHDVRENSDSVVVTVRIRARFGTGPDLGILEEVTVQLREPLGDRRVLDSEGRVVSEID